MKIRHKVPAIIPTASMADVAFLLIIFFMLTAVYASTRGLLFAYPKEDPANIRPEDAIHVHVRGVGDIQVDRRQATLPEVHAYIQSKMAQAPNKPVIIETEPNVPYYGMIDVLDILKQLEVRHVSIPTRSEIQRWRALPGSGRR